MVSEHSSSTLLKFTNSEKPSVLQAEHLAPNFKREASLKKTLGDGARLQSGG